MAASPSSQTHNFLEDLKAALAARDRDSTNRAVEGLLESRVRLGAEWRRISDLMRISGEFSLAHRAIDAFIKESGGGAQARYAKVVLLSQSNRLREAHDLLAKLPADVPDLGGHFYVLGNLAMTLGRVDEAREHLLRALKHRPGWGPTWLTLATAVNLAKEAAIGDQLLAERRAAEQQSAPERARYFYALGKLHVDRKEPEAAFAAYQRGADLLRGTTPYSRNGNENNARAAMTGYAEGFFDRMRARQSRDTSRPIFVTGLPRSGTTLVEHILASHSEVQDGGELNIIQHLAVEVGGVSGDLIERYIAAGKTLDDLGGLYLHLMAERFGTTGQRVVDKTIDVGRCFGIIASALPDAPLIWMQRDPMDNAWSAFRTFFIHGVGWSYSLSDIAHHFRLQDQLRDFWKQQLGDRLLVVPYAELVDEPQLWTRRVVAHCGLEEEAAVHTPHETKRVVATASAMQVRRPINRDGLGVAEPYKAWMGPFVDAYFD